MTDTLSKLRADSVVVDEAMLAAAGLQYAEITIQTLVGVLTDLAVAKEAKKHEGMTDLIGTAVEIMNAARSILHRVSDGSSEHALVAYRMLQVSDGHVSTVLSTTRTWGLAVKRPGTLRNLEKLDADPLATVERAMARPFGMKRYVRMLSGETTLEDFVQGR
jgi:hypothetical protein